MNFSPASLVFQLSNLTSEDKVIWEKSLQNMHRAVYNGFSFYTEIFQDDRPLLQIERGGRKSKIQGYGLGIDELNGAIESQYQRLGKYEHSAEYKARMENLDKRKKAEEKKTLETLKQLTEEFIKITTSAP